MMDASMFAILEVSGYALAAVLAIAAAVFFFTQDIRAVRDEMTGRSAARAIEELRTGRNGTFRAVSGARSTLYGGARLSDESTSGSLHVRFMGDEAPTVANVTEKVDEGAAAPEEDLREAGTTLLGAVPAASSESGATLLGGGAEGEAVTAATGDTDSTPSEAGTTLLGGEAPIGAPEPSEAGTTLLEGRRA